MALIQFTVNFDALATLASDSGGDGADVMPLTGKVTFTPVIEDIPVPAATLTPRPAAVALRPREGWIDTDGRLKNKPGGTVGIRLIANDPSFDLDKLPYKVEFDLRTLEGLPVKMNPGYFNAPAADTPFNLVNAVPAPGTAGTAIMRGYSTIWVQVSVSPPLWQQYIPEEDQYIGPQVTITPDVTLTNVATLTNKTLISPTLTTPKVSVFTDNNGASLWVFPTVANAVNAFRFEPSIAGNPLQIIPNPSSADTNIDLRLAGRGTGRVIIGGAGITSANPWFSGTIRDNTGAALLGLNVVANPANYLSISNTATGVAPTLNAWGTDTDVGINITPRGAGRVAITNLSAVQPWIGHIRNAAGGLGVDISGTSDTVNYVRLLPGVAGSSPGLVSIGVDTNLDLHLTPKGTGRVIANALWATNPRINGTIFDNNGNSAFRFNPPAGVVNYLELVTGAAGQPVWLKTVGSDTSISMYLWPKAAGNILLWNETGQHTAISANGADTVHNLRLQSKGTGQIQLLDGSGASIFRAIPNANAVNYVGVYNTATGIDPVISAIGETNAGLSINSLGTGRVIVRNLSASSAILNSPRIGSGLFDANGLPAVGVSAITDAANWIQVTPAIAGASPRVSATGNDTNVDLTLLGRGTGRVVIPSLTASGPQIYGIIRDSNLNPVLNLVTASNVVNYLQIWGGATGGSANINANGSNTDVGIAITPKGAGRINITNLTAANPRISGSIRDSGDKPLLALQTTSTADNYLTVYSHGAGNSPGMYATGSDANIGIRFDPKGSGNLQIFEPTGQTAGIDVLGADANIGLTISPKGTGRTTVTNLSATNAALTWPRLNSILDSNANTMLNFIAAASATNYFQIYNGAAGSGITMLANGPDTDINFAIQPKGAGRVNVTNLTSTSPRIVAGINDSNGALLIGFTATTNAACGWVMVNEVSGGAGPLLYPSGPDTNADARIAPRGAGRVVITQMSATAAALTAPRIDNLRDSSGLMILNATGVASAVNYFSINNAAAAGTLVLSATGTDTNIPIRFAPKGNGNIEILAATGQTPVIQAMGADTNHNLVYMSKGSGTHNFRDGAGLNSLVLSSIASSVNYLNIRPSTTGGQVMIQALGADTNVHLALRPQGLGGVYISDGSNATIAHFQPVASSVNYWYLNNAATGVAPSLAAAGTDANINMQLTPKGTGNILIYAATGQTPTIQAVGADANHNLVLTSKGLGNTRIQDGAGRAQLTLVSTASAVNSLQVQSGATGSPVYVRAIGGDTNVELCLRTAGLGQFTVRSGTANALIFGAYPVADAVNYPEVVNSATGAEVVYRASGADADIPIAIRPKGAASLLVRGFGNTRIAEFSSRNANMANRIVFQGGEAGSGPSIYPAGEANINLRIFASGTGIIGALSMISHKTYTTAGRPAANTVPAGTEFWNTTTKEPNYSDGTNWYDANGVLA